MFETERENSISRVRYALCCEHLPSNLFWADTRSLLRALLSLVPFLTFCTRSQSIRERQGVANRSQVQTPIQSRKRFSAKGFSPFLFPFRFPFCAPSRTFCCLSISYFVNFASLNSCTDRKGCSPHCREAGQANKAGQEQVTV